MKEDWMSIIRSFTTGDWSDGNPIRKLFNGTQYNDILNSIIEDKNTFNAINARARYSDTTGTAIGVYDGMSSRIDEYEDHGEYEDDDDSGVEPLWDDEEEYEEDEISEGWNITQDDKVWSVDMASEDETDDNYLMRLGVK